MMLSFLYFVFKYPVLVPTDEDCMDGRLPYHSVLQVHITDEFACIVSTILTRRPSTEALFQTMLFK